MKNIKRDMVLIIIFLLFTIITLTSNVHAAGSMGMSINKTSGYVGDKFTVTISGINGKVSITGSSNISLSTSGTVWVEGSMTITGTAKSVGTGTVTVTPVDATTTAAEPEFVTAPASRSISITTKPVANNTKTTTTTNTAKTTTKSTNTTTNKSTTTNTKKTETKKDDFYINKLVLKGIKKIDTENKSDAGHESGQAVEEVAIKLSPEFKKNTYKYTATIENDIEKLELEKDAGAYNKNITVTGLDNLKEGENSITVKLAASGQPTRTYTINVTKKAQTVETSSGIVESTDNTEKNEEENLENENNETVMVSMPLVAFILMQFAIIAVEVLIIFFVLKKIMKKK